MSQHDLGPLSGIVADAIGVPGQRRFRLQLLAASGESALIWVEKAQVAALSEAIRAVLADEGYRYQPMAPDDAGPPPVMPLAPDIEMDIRAGQLSLGLNREAEMLVLVCLEPDESGEAAEQTLTAGIDYRRAYELGRQIVELVAAGRPTCPLCTAPIDAGGHVCPRLNGHRNDI
ncbi:MAG: DUF3090 domain-containing protein [Dehalococcoidia bacterium]